MAESSDGVPQFATAEYAPGQAALTCAGCRRPIDGAYYQNNGAPVCGDCTAKIRARNPQDSHAAFVRAVTFGVGGALAGFALYVGVALATGLVIGLVSLAVGFIVGKAMRLGSGGIGGRRYQIVAALLTYMAVSMSAVPIAIQHQLSHPPPQQSSAAAGNHAGLTAGSIGILVLLGVASPLLALQNPTQGLIGLIILLVGIRFAWAFTARRTINISGPHTPAPPPTPATGAI